MKKEKEKNQKGKKKKRKINPRPEQEKNFGGQSLTRTQVQRVDPPFWSRLGRFRCLAGLDGWMMDEESESYRQDSIIIHNNSNVN